MSTQPTSPSPPPGPQSPRSQYANFPSSPRTPLSPRAPLSPRTPISPRRPSPPRGFSVQYPPNTNALEVPTPAGFVPMTRRDSYATTAGYEPKTPLSPTFKEDVDLEKAETEVQKHDKSDLKLKLRIRIGKVIVRGVSWCCSLVVLALACSALSIFRATKDLPPRNSLPAWAANTPVWPIVLNASIAAISLLLASGVLFGYWRGGHRRAEKLSHYWTFFAIVTFIFAIIMWAVAAGILNGLKAISEGKDLWGWACKDNQRRALFQDDVPYQLVCRQMDWTFVCALIEISLELVTIGLYAFAFYRILSKRRLRKSMDVREQARRSYWLAKIKEDEEKGVDPELADATARNTQLNTNGQIVEQTATHSPTAGGFQLQPPPKGRVHQAPVMLNPPIPSAWQQAHGYDPANVPLPPTPAFPVDQRMSYQPVQPTPLQHSFTSENVVVPPTPASVRFNLDSSRPPVRSSPPPSRSSPTPSNS